MAASKSSKSDAPAVGAAGAPPLVNQQNIGFDDGRGPKSKSTPAEFASDWHFERHLNDLERGLAAAHNRKAELHAMGAETVELEAEQDRVIASIRAELASYGRGQKAAAKRPRAAAKETR